MFEWKVNQIRVEMMERVLNHMEKQGYEVQLIVPLRGVLSEQQNGELAAGETKIEVIMAGKRLLSSTVPEMHRGMPAVTPENLDVVYGREKST